MTDFILVVLRSNRAKAVIVGFAIATLQKYVPDMMPDEETLHWLYGLIIAFIAGDTVRPIDPDKPSALDQQRGYR